MNRANVIRLLCEAVLSGYWQDARYFARSLKRTPSAKPVYLWTPHGPVLAPHREPRA
jgi:hypothetical protein